MKEYILSVAGVVLLSAVLTVILPSGKMGKFIKGAMKLFTLVVLISPFAKRFELQESTQSGETISLNEDYLTHCAELLAREDETAIAEEIFRGYAVTADVEVRREAVSRFPLEKISVKITDFGINGQDEHIHIMSLIQADVTEKYGCEAVVE